jgi:hypothetical protein
MTVVFSSLWAWPGNDGGEPRNTPGARCWVSREQCARDHNLNHSELFLGGELTDRAMPERLA